MRSTTAFAFLLERFFLERLRQQRHASAHTISSYRDTFRLLFEFTQKTLRKAPSSLELSDLNASLIGVFLNDIEQRRRNTVRTRNLRLAAIRSFCRFACLYEPDRCAHFQRILAIPCKRYTRREINFLTRAEIDKLLSAPDRSTWLGRRDYALLVVALQTGLRLSELTSLRREALILETSPHVRCTGKGRKERCTPLAKQTVSILKSWLKELSLKGIDVLFPTHNGGTLSSDAVQDLLKKYVEKIRGICPSLKDKRISPHVLRHYFLRPTMSRSRAKTL